MSLTSKEESWVKKEAQVRLKTLQIVKLQKDKATALVPLQTQINELQASFNSQIATKNNEIKTLESEIESLA